MTKRPALHLLRSAALLLATALAGSLLSGAKGQPGKPGQPASAEAADAAQAAARSPLPPLIVAGLAAAALAAIAVTSPRLAAAGWLIGLVFLSAIPLGSLAWLMVARLTGGRWGDCLRPAFVLAVPAIPLFLIVAIPVLLALPLLYPWAAGAGVMKADVAALYLNTPLFLLRAGIAVVGWTSLAFVLPRLANGGGILLAGIGLIFHALMVSLLSLDWILSIEPPFISTSFGATVVITQMLAALAFAAWLAPEFDARAARDLGGLMLTLTLGVTYLNFMTLLVIWYGNLPDRVSWFVERAQEPWATLALASFVFGSAIPILLLLLARVRGSRRALRAVAASILIGIALYDAWLLAPHYGAPTLGAAALAILAMACAFVAMVRVGWPAAVFGRARTAP